MSLPKETVIAIASLCGKLRYIAGVMRQYEDVDQLPVALWPKNLKPGAQLPRSAEYALMNVRTLMTAIHQALDVSKQLPDIPLVRDIEAALSLTWETLCQPDTPMEWAIFDKKPKQAIREGSYSLYLAIERGCADLLEDLAAKLVTCQRRGFPKADVIHASNNFVPLECDWNILEYLANRDAREKAENIAVRGAGATLLKKRLRALERAGWIDRKEGKRSGYAITPLGREKLRDRNATVTRP